MAEAETPTTAAHEDDVEIALTDLDGTAYTGYEKRENVDYGALEKLREPFSDAMVSKLPKNVRKAAEGEPKFSCIAGTPNFRNASKDGVACGGYHALSIHLDYVGHAALTARLLDADPLWDWQPLAWDVNGMPFIDKAAGGMWIKLTVGGMTRLGFGDAQGKSGPNAIKEMIGDGLRNAAMRFGAALNLWHKGDLYDTAVEQGKVAVASGPAASAKPATTRSRSTKATEATPAPTGQAPASDSQAAVLSEPEAPQGAPAAVQRPTPPSDWEQRVAESETLESLDDLYQIAARDGWWNKALYGPSFTARKLQIEARMATQKRADEDAAAQVAAAFQPPSEEVAF